MLPVAEQANVKLALHPDDPPVAKMNGVAKIFTHYKHVTTAALMAHARGVACLAAQELRLSLAEYPSTEVKKSLTGNGQASKQQVARMVGQWLQHVDPGWSRDATDALALAVVHAHVARQQRNLPAGVTK